MRKGFTLTEVLVAMTIFAMTFAVCLATYLIGVRFESRQREYLFFESVCQDIDQYSDVYSREWNTHYFDDGSQTQYYASDFTYVGSSEADKYELSFYYDDADQLIVNIKVTDSDRYIIKDLNYGGSRYEQA